MRDSDIIKKLQAGNENEVDMIISKHYPSVYSYLYRRCGNQDMAKELTQETFYKFFQNIHSYEPKGKLLNYLYRIALHLFYDEIRKKKFLIEDEFDVNQIEDKQESISEHIAKKQQIQEVKEILRKLPSNHQDILIFRFYQELKFKDISLITGLPISTLKSRYQAALKLVKHYWKEGEHS